MTVYAVTKGRRVALAASHGATPVDVMRSVCGDSLSGSAYQNAELDTADGGKLDYLDVDKFEVDEAGS